MSRTLCGAVFLSLIYCQQTDFRLFPLFPLNIFVAVAKSKVKHLVVQYTDFCFFHFLVAGSCDHHEHHTECFSLISLILPQSLLVQGNDCFFMGTTLFYFRTLYIHSALFKTVMKNDFLKSLKSKVEE